MLNPSGMAMIKQYAMEGAYQYDSIRKANTFHASAVDSTSPSGIAGAAYYTLRRRPSASETASISGEGRWVPDGLIDLPPQLAGYETGLSFAYPLTSRISVGVTGRYFNFTYDTPNPAAGSTSTGEEEPVEDETDTSETSEPTPSTVPYKTRGISADAGITLKVSDQVSLGIVAYNIGARGNPQVQESYGAGVAVLLSPRLSLYGDGVWHSSAASQSWTFAVGGEWQFANQFVIRSGASGAAGVQRLGGGASFFTGQGAVDLAAVFETGPSNLQNGVVFSAALRLFLPQ